MKLVHRQSARGGRFSFVDEDDHRVADMTYAREGEGVVVVRHTRVSPERRGQGLAKRLLSEVVAWARAEGVRIVPECAFVRRAFERSPELGDVRAA